ncbi:hypothetical protein MNEG_12434 [Monoraphidium neglectum]|uniref:NmrA-like domain-containing protein n=1 Tax=Monoraphidium neglectum TaxID=145388 RepID=A0A0D2LVC4_9CHLO|nr:hypothetical protein MNEG_12434 [Monoraphidium neglectum]KIY95529.1 hypothetical protein MNEG_12434 [Monoraphidium neglectum]|eukprot:XP_013894549.1 hypothetical protein MNEG_12434 [Monoraphidium neglectum]
MQVVSHPMTCVATASSRHRARMAASAPRATRPREASQAARRRGDAAVARAGWDVARFAKTVFFFNDPSKLIGGLFSGLRPTSEAGAEGAVQTLLRGAPAPVGAAEAEAGVVLVTGATGGVGKRVVQLLLERGRRVRVLVRDVDKAKALLLQRPARPPGAAWHTCIYGCMLTFILRGPGLTTTQ